MHLSDGQMEQLVRQRPGELLAVDHRVFCQSREAYSFLASWLVRQDVRFELAGSYGHDRDESVLVLYPIWQWPRLGYGEPLHKMMVEALQDRNCRPYSGHAERCRQLFAVVSAADRLDAMEFEQAIQACLETDSWRPMRVYCERYPASCQLPRRERIRSWRRWWQRLRQALRLAGGS